MKKPMPALLALLLLLALQTGPAQAQTPDPAAGPVAPSNWQTVMTEGFEGAWPTTGWSVSDLSGDGFQRFWGKEDNKRHGGSFSVWPASAGTHAVDPASAPYPDDLDSQMIYGPFDLSNSLDAEIRFWLWLDVEANFDYLYVGASGTGSTYAEAATWEGTQDWSEIILNLGAYAGDNSVWVRWDFYSDFINGGGGAYIDDIAISKLPLDAPVVGISRSGANITLQWPKVDGATQYEVWRGVNNPYFAPGADCAGAPTVCTIVKQGAGGTASYTHTGGSGNTTNNYTYVVRSVGSANGFAVRSVGSNRVGEFDFALTR